MLGGTGGPRSPASVPAPPPDGSGDPLLEHTPIARDPSRPHPTRLSDFILGSQDGIVNVLGIILGLAAATPDVRLILVATLAALGAESIAMSAVAYSSTLARRRLYIGERTRELREMREVPETERDDIRRIFSSWGFRGVDLDELVDRVCRNPRAMIELMMSFELGLPAVSVGAPLESALLVGGATLVGHAIPLLPFFFLHHDVVGAVVAATVLSALTLFATGWYEARVTGGRWYRNGLQMVIIGLTGGIAGFLIGHIVGVLPGL